MPLSHIGLDELRNHCRHRIETLELWLRRLIHDKLSAAYGSDYFDYEIGGQHLLRAAIRQRAKERMDKESQRYGRAVDALMLGHLIDILCKQELYRDHFRDALHDAFPNGPEEARTFLSRLEPIRNALSHANPISHHQALRVFCYVEDVIKSIQGHYANMGAADEFNAPSFVMFRDSAGNSVPIGDTRAHLRLTETRFRVGDTIRLEVDVDDTAGGSTVVWRVQSIVGESGTGRSFVLELTQRHVNQNFIIIAELSSPREWHRHGQFDARLMAVYTVLPSP